MNMIQKLWYSKNRFYWILIPFSLIYGVIVVARRFFYRIGLLSSFRSPVPIVVIGNLSVGGNGKTPLAISIIEALQKQGLKVGLVSRGYGGKSAHYPILVNQLSDAKQIGDEPLLISQRTAIPIAVSPNRCDAVKLLLQHYPLDVILTDDGLQHYALQRDVEIVVVDGKRAFGNGWWLPAGPMRETRSRLKSVDMIFINGADTTNIAHTYVNKTYMMQLAPQYAINLKTGEQKKLSELNNICAIAGIGDPNRFFDMLKKLQTDVKKTVAFADHQIFNYELLNGLVNDQQTLLMTEKDAVKCRKFANINWWYLPINAEVSPAAMNKLCSLINKKET